MSYLLDALRKAERERQGSEPNPVMQSIMVDPVYPKEKPTLLLTLGKAGLALVPVIVVSYLGWHFLLDQSRDQHPANEPLSSTQGQSQSALSNPTESEFPHPVQLKDKAQSQQQRSPTFAQIIAQKKSAMSSAKLADKYLKPTNNQLSARVGGLDFAANQKLNGGKSLENKPKPKVLPPPPKKLPFFDELPFETRNSMPPLSVNAFSFSNSPRDSFVIINMIKYRIGDLIKDTIRVKDIRNDSVVLQYGNLSYLLERP